MKKVNPVQMKAEAYRKTVDSTSTDEGELYRYSQIEEAFVAGHNSAIDEITELRNLLKKTKKNLSLLEHGIEHGTFFIGKELKSTQEILSATIQLIAKK